MQLLPGSCMTKKENEQHIHYVSWEVLRSTKTEGGLGFRNLREFQHRLPCEIMLETSP